MIGVGVFTQHLGVVVEHQPVTAIADGVRRHLHPAAARLAHGRKQPLRWRNQQAAVAVIVAVGLEQRGAAGAERTVRVELHA